MEGLEENKDTMFFRERKRQRVAKATLQRPQSFPPQGFVATFKSLVIFVSKKNFVPLCLCVKLLTQLSEVILNTKDTKIYNS